jgi:hypothetical protein
MLELENQLEAVAAPPPEPTIPEPEEEEDPRRIRSGVWACFTLSEPRLDFCYLIDVGYALNKVMCCRSVVVEWIF